MKNIITLSITALLLAALGTNLSFAAKPTGGGGGGKIKVTGASPGFAPQGDVLMVTIAGENFEAGASVTFLVGGTKDKSQIKVTGVRVKSSIQLEADIEVNSGALTVDYDIEVQAISGRKGKGTTLFKVNQQAEVCVRDVDAEFPSLVYLYSDVSGNIMGSTNEGGTFSIYLSSSDGCEQTALLKDAPHMGAGDEVRVVFNAPVGLVVWNQVTNYPEIDSSHNRLWGMRFEVQGSTVITDDPVILVDTELNGFILQPDVHLFEDGLISILHYESSVGDPRPRWLNLITGLHIDALSAGGLNSKIAGECIVKEPDGNCLTLRYARLAFNADASAIYFSSSPPERPDFIFGKADITAGVLGAPEILWFTEGYLDPRGLSPDQTLFVYPYSVRRKSGKVVNRQLRMLPMDYCILNGCSMSEGTVITDIGSDRASVIVWQSSNTLLWDGMTQNSQMNFISRYSFTDGLFRDPINIQTEYLRDLDTVQ